ncbi:hypothetical protein E2562_038845 [Oryza meyeriana var. granulata]|uniref:Uncharacterized protein n=1 Tax=Oryza meyeriana var. granulata TaxID=110450 RepID=A0A6G1FGT2_9ORYZ|nr:hypothetical protein E2562_038845 [Oryza meyeriana var. granulata]
MVWGTVHGGPPGSHRRGRADGPHMSATKGELSPWARPSLQPWHGAARGKPKQGKALAGQTMTKDA